MKRLGFSAVLLIGLILGGITPSLAAELAIPQVDITEYNCIQSTHPPDAIGSKIEGTSTGAIIGLFDENTRSRVGNLSFVGGLWFFDGGESTEVETGTRVLDFSFGDYHPGGSTNLKICASGKYFILSSENRRFRIHFPAAAFAAFILEIKSPAVASREDFAPADVRAPGGEASPGRPSSVGSNEAVITLKGACQSKTAAGCVSSVTRDQFEKLVKVLTPPDKPAMSPDVKRNFALQYAKLLVFANAAREAGLDDDSRVQQIYTFAKNQILTEALNQHITEEVAAEKLTKELQAQKVKDRAAQISSATTVVLGDGYFEYGGQQSSRASGGQASPGRPASVGSNEAVITLKGACQSKTAVGCVSSVTRDQFEKLVKALTPPDKPAMSPDVKRNFALQYAKLLVFANAAREAGLDDDSRVQQIYTFAKNQILTEALNQHITEEVAAEKLTKELQAQKVKDRAAQISSATTVVLNDGYFQSGYSQESKTIQTPPQVESKTDQTIAATATTSSPATDEHAVAPTKQTIQKAQQQLRALGYDAGSVDRAIGPKTTAALKTFQAEHGLTVTGTFGPETLASLNQATAAAKGKAASSKTAGPQALAANLSQTPKASSPLPALPPLRFTPPASEGSANEFLSALHALGDEYVPYDGSTARDEIQLREMSLAVVNAVSTFQGVEFIPAEPRSSGNVVGGMAMATKPVSDDEKRQVYLTVLSSTEAYLGKKCRIIDHGTMKIVITLYGGDSMYFDNNQRPWGVMKVRLFLLDTEKHHMIWYSDKAWGLGRNAPNAADFAAKSIAEQLDKLFGVSATQE